MKILTSILLLITTTFGSYYQYKPDPCDCFSLSLANEPYTYNGEVCYDYQLSRKSQDASCGNIDYYVLSGGQSSDCGISTSDLPGLVTYTSNDAFIADNPFYGAVDGLKIVQACYDAAAEYTICFDNSRVGGTQSNGDVGFKNSNGDSYSCPVYNTLPDFCGGIGGGQGTNSPPDAVDDNVETTEDNPVDIKVTDNDTDPDDDLLSISDVGTPTNGGSAVKISDTRIEYTPSSQSCANVAPSDTYTDTFTYTITDGKGEEDTATVTVTVTCNRQGPIAKDDQYTTDEDKSINTSPLTGDFDPDGGDISLDSVGIPDFGTVGVPDSNGNVLYTPDPTRCRKISAKSYTDSYQYTIIDDDDQLTATATVRITVNCPGLPPIAKDNQYTTNENKPISTAPLTGDFDPDGGNIKLYSVGTPEVGTVSDPDSNGNVLYTPDPSRCSKISGNSYTDTFTYTIIDDDDQLTATATVYITVKCIRQGPIAKDNQYTTNEKTPIYTSPLTGDSDPDGGNIKLYSVGKPQFGILSAPDSNGNILYTPDRRRCDKIYARSYTDSYQYTIIDDDDRLTASATVRIQVQCIRRRGSSSSSRGGRGGRGGKGGSSSSKGRRGKGGSSSSGVRKGRGGRGGSSSSKGRKGRGSSSSSVGRKGKGGRGGSSSSGGRRGRGSSSSKKKGLLYGKRYGGGSSSSSRGGKGGLISKIISKKKGSLYGGRGGRGGSSSSSKGGRKGYGGRGGRGGSSSSSKGGRKGYGGSSSSKGGRGGKSSSRGKGGLIPGLISKKKGGGNKKGSTISNIIGGGQKTSYGGYYAEGEEGAVVDTNDGVKETLNIDKWTSYIIIAVVTVVFNIIAYFATYCFCIRPIVKKKPTGTYIAASNKVVDDSDVDDVDYHQEQEDLNQDV